jgi:hypothetical protein
MLKEQADHQVAVAAHKLRAGHGKLVLDPARTQPTLQEEVQQLEDLCCSTADQCATYLPPPGVLCHSEFTKCCKTKPSHPPRPLPSLQSQSLCPGKQV